MPNFTVFIYKYGLFATCLIILIEYACFPISSEIVLPFSGAIANMNKTNFILILFLSVISGLIGSLICYFIGRFLGNKVISLITSKSAKAKKGFDYSIAFFNKYGNKAVCFARLIPLCRTYISFVAGAVKLNTISFILYSSIGISIWNFILIGLGYTLGSNWNYVIKLYNNYKNALIISVICTMLIALLVKMSHHFEKEDR